jgi:hypothetical protein
MGQEAQEGHDSKAHELPRSKSSPLVLDSCQLLARSGIFRATDPRDYFYGFLGVCKLQLEPNYRLNDVEVGYAFFDAWLDFWECMQKDKPPDDYDIDPLWLLQHIAPEFNPQAYVPTWLFYPAAIARQSGRPTGVVAKGQLERADAGVFRETLAQAEVVSHTTSSASPSGSPISCGVTPV